MRTPYYVFDASEFKDRIKKVGDKLPGTLLTYSIKANPFLLHVLPDTSLIKSVEVCSPGELKICKALSIPGERIIFSGVMKEERDVRAAFSYGVKYITAESKRHFELINKVSKRSGHTPEVLLRLTSGNQFGMSGEDILSVLKDSERENIPVAGIHYFSGTDKKKRGQIEKDLSKLREFLSEIRGKGLLKDPFIEYGPGLSVDYYEPPYEERDMELIDEISPLIKELAGEYKTGIELGRFLAAPSGSYYTKVCDIKENDGATYVITDGGTHHIKYFGQNMAMKIPPVKVIRNGEEIRSNGGPLKDHCICGSLCTSADVMIRKAFLPELKVGDILRFGRSGAYSFYEGALFFLSRDLPEIWLKNGEKLKKLRGRKESWRYQL